MTIDSNILIAYLTGEESIITALSQWKQQGELLILSTIVEAEVLSFARWNESERIGVQSLLEHEFLSIPFDRTVARIAAQLRRDRAMKLPDAGIAATALYVNAPLVTRNVRDFRNIAGLKVMNL